MMESLPKEIFSFLLENKEEGAIIGAPLLVLAKYYKQIKNIIFRDNPSLRNIVDIMNDVYEHTTIIIVDICNSYERDLEEWLSKNTHSYSKDTIEASKDMYRGIMYGAFFFGYVNFFQFFAERTEWPDKNSKEFDAMIDGKCQFIYKNIWSKFDSFYSNSFIITIEGRRQRMEEGYEDMKRIFIDVVKYWYYIRGIK